MNNIPKSDVTEVFSVKSGDIMGLSRHQGEKTPWQNKVKKQQYAAVLCDLEAMDRIKGWVLGHQNGLSPSISALRLAGELGYAELERELSALRDIQTNHESSYDQAIKEGLKKKGVRKKLFLPLAAAVFRQEPKVRLCRLINLSGICSLMRGASGAVGTMASVSSDFEIEQFAEVADVLFDALDGLDAERDLMLLRLICVLHVIFRCHKECGGFRSDSLDRLHQRFYSYLRVPESDRSIERLKSQVNSIVRKILKTEVPETMFSDEFEQWWILIFERINEKGRQIIVQLADDLRLIPGNPFRLTDNGDDLDEPEDVGEENEDEPTTEDAAEDPPLTECAVEPDGAIQEVEAADPVDSATREAEMLNEASPTKRSKEMRKYFDDLAKNLAPLEYNNYKELSVLELQNLLVDLQVVEERLGGIRSMLEGEIRGRESAASDSGEDV